MAENNGEPEVKDVDTVYIEPAGKDEENVDDEPAQDSSPAEAADEDAEDEESDADKPDQIVDTTTPPAAQAPQAQAEAVGDDVLAEVEGETPRERALRLEVTRLRKAGRGERAKEILGSQPPAQQAQPTEISPERKKVLEKYKPEEIGALREALDVLAEDMGFVRKDQLESGNYVERANDELNTFLDKHPEYLPENDKDGTLWNAFKEEYALYKQPSNPKDFTKIFERIHKDVFGIKPGGALPKVKAAQEKIKVASHAGASSQPPTPRAQRAAAPQGTRFDMLKGFSEDELAELQG